MSSLEMNFWQLQSKMKQKQVPKFFVPKNIFACPFSVHNITSLSNHEQSFLALSSFALIFTFLPNIVVCSYTYRKRV